MRAHEFVTEVSRRDFLKNLAASAVIPGGWLAGDTIKNMGTKPPTTTTTKIEPVKPPEISTDTQSQSKTELSPQQRQYLLMTTAERAGIHGLELAQFMAQCAVESWNFRALETWTPEEKLRKLKTQANVGNISQDDNWTYRARGYIHLFGRENYQRMSKLIDIDLVKNPDLAADENIAADIAVKFWQNRVTPFVKSKAQRGSQPDWSNTRTVTYKINPKLELLKEREAAFKNWRERIANYERGYRTLEEAKKRKRKKSRTSRALPRVYGPIWGWSGDSSSGDGGGGGEG